MIGKFNETRLPGKENFYSTLNMEDVADSEYNHEELVRKDLVEYHDLYLKSNTLLLTDVFENFRKMCFELYQLELYAIFKKTKVELEL